MTRSTDRSSAVIFSFDSSMWIWRRSPPFTVTAATPSTRSRRGTRSCLGDLAEGDAIEVAADADPHDRGGRGVELLDARDVGFFGQPAAHAIDARPHFVRRFVEVRAPREAQAHLTGALVRGRVDLLEAGHRRERLLERTHDELLDFLWSDAAVSDAHRDARIGHVRHQVDRQTQQRDAPEQDHHDAKS